MTNNPTIDGVSRWLIEQSATFLEAHSSGPSIESNLAADLRALLDTPPNNLREHCKQCAEVVKTWPEWKQNCLGGVPAVERQELPFPGYPPVPADRKIAPPEVSALQSTIAQLQVRIAELESGKGEPFTHMRIDVDGNPYRCRAEDHDDSFPVYRAQPAPVAVVLPERKTFSPPSYRDGHAEGWNACLDATAALNEVRK